MRHNPSGTSRRGSLRSASPEDAGSFYIMKTQQRFARPGFNFRQGNILLATRTAFGNTKARMKIPLR
jgi:hypothetical protein